MKNLYKKLFEIQGLEVKKDANNPFYKSKYMTLDNIVETIAPLLKEHKLLVFHNTKNKEVCTTVCDIESEDKIVSKFPLPENNDPQKLGSAVTYAKRYNIGQLFNIVTDEDDDGNSVTQNKPAYVQKTVQAQSSNSSICKTCKSIMIQGKSGKLYCKPCYIKYAEEQKKKQVPTINQSIDNIPDIFDDGPGF